MKKRNIARSRKLRYGGVSAALTALVIALVVMFNAGVSALSNRYNTAFFWDMTAAKHYTLSKECRTRLETDFAKIKSDREEFNKNLPQSNLELAQNNRRRVDETITLAQKNITVSERNIAIAERNRELLSKSGVIAEENLAIAERNLTLAENFYDYIKDNEDIEEAVKSDAQEQIRLAGENLALAEANIETVTANRARNTGYSPLGVFAALEMPPSFKYFGSFASHINDEDSAAAARNRRITDDNIAIAEENSQIAEENLKSARRNAEAGAVPGDADYIAPKSFIEYKPFEGFATYAKISGSESPRQYESYFETENDEKLVGEMKVKIIFCDEEDAIKNSSSLSYVYGTAKDLAEAFPNIISLEFIDIVTNPSAVQKYKKTTNAKIYPNNVIIESGSEYASLLDRTFFTFRDASANDPWAYSGEKKFASTILSLLQAESPIACLTINHGERYSDLALPQLLDDAGYEVQFINLAVEEIPANCRLLVVYNPTSDFLVRDGVSDISEIEKINKYLDQLNSMLVFMSPDSPVLPNFEEYLEEWGVVYNRTYDEITGQALPHMIKDSSQSLTSDGMTIVGNYTTQGLGASIHKDMRSVASPASVIFKNSMSISYPKTYDTLTAVDENDETINYRYGYYYSNGVSRSIYDIFVSSPNAVALAGGQRVAAANSLEPFKLMTITSESQMISNETSDYSYVIACASTAFASADMLDSASYGNSEVLISALRSVARETIVVDFRPKPFDTTQISSLTTAQANQYTVVLSVVPPAVVLGLGIYIVVRRKYS